MKHKKKDRALQELINHMRTGETNHLKDNMHSVFLNSSKANSVESIVSTNIDKFQGKDKKN